MRVSAAPQRDLVLIGGGHSHVLVIRQLAMSAPQDLRITLISPSAFTPYSGMLPGLLAGHYSFAETHIDLMRLCQWAGVRFLTDTVESLDPVAQRLTCRHRGELGYDLLSIDIGSQPELDSVPGAREYATPVKPVAGFWERWQRLLQEICLHNGESAEPRALRIAVVGGGAGSVEIALAVAHRLGGEKSDHKGDRKPRITLYSGSSELLPGYSRGVRRAVEAQLATLDVELHGAHRVSRVEESRMLFESAPDADYDTLIWCTGAAAAHWIRESGLPVDERGFMVINDCLQSTGYPNVFGAGDIAIQHRHPRPKAGVYAVRQGPVLAKNLNAFVCGDRLQNHKPQSGFLSLLSLGPRQAVAQRNGLSVKGAWVWRWKNRIDRQFMQRFSDLPVLDMPARNTAVSLPRALSPQNPCGGCGAKVSADTLAAVLAELRALYPQQLPPGDGLDDAAPLDAALPIMQSLDALRGLIDDPWRMGRIAAQHALSDLYAIGAQPHSALALVILPFAAQSLLHRDLRMVLSGALSVLQEAGCKLHGGHSMQGSELHLGFAVNGVLNGQAALHKRGARVGDKLLLTKALGTGALFAAQMQGQTDGIKIEHALSMMESGNAAAAALAREFRASALTDITGFGLAGHVLEMLDESLSASISLDALPVLPGALEAMAAGIFSTLHEPNRQAVAARWALPLEAPLTAQLLFDPQTSGGLLMAVPPEQASDACRALQVSCVDTRVVGEVLARESAADPLRIS